MLSFRDCPATLRHEDCFPGRAPGRVPGFPTAEKHRSIFVRRGEGDWMPGKVGKEITEEFVHGLMPAKPKS